MPVNDYLRRNSDIAFYIKFCFTLMIDIMVVMVIFHWTFISLKWQFAVDVILFFTGRYICTRLISYRNPEGIYWPDSSFMSLSNAGLSEQQYQVSGYTGILVLSTLYWSQQEQSKSPHDLEKKVLSVVSILCIFISVFVELSFRISYCTGRS